MGKLNQGPLSLYTAGHAAAGMMPFIPPLCSLGDGLFAIKAKQQTGNANYSLRLSRTEPKR